LISRAKRLPPRGTPKKAASAHAIPDSVCARRRLRPETPKRTIDTQPAIDAQMATRGASGPREPPARMDAWDETIMEGAWPIGT